MSTPANTTQLTQTLEHLGLGTNEANLYLILLRYPGSSVQELQTKTPFPRTMLYYVLGRLLKDGLVGTAKTKGKTLYTAESPDRLYDLLSKREEEFVAQAKTLRELVPTLKQRYRLAGKRPNVRMFEGMDAYKKALEEMIISQPREVLAFGDPDARGASGIEARETHDGRRRTKKILKKVLLFPSSESTAFLKRRSYDDYTQFRYVGASLDPFVADVQLYDGKLLYTTYEDREPIAILIEDEALCTMQKSFFRLLWEAAEDVTLTRFES